MNHQHPKREELLTQHTRTRHPVNTADVRTSNRVDNPSGWNAGLILCDPDDGRRDRASHDVVVEVVPGDEYWIADPDR